MFGHMQDLVACKTVRKLFAGSAAAGHVVLTQLGHAAAKLQATKAQQ